MATLNGAPVELEDLKALALVNYGHFTSMRIDDGHVRGLSLHMDRLVRDCRAVFDVGLDPDRVLRFARQAVGGKTGSFVVRVTIFDPALEMGHPGSDAEPQILVTTRPAGAMPPPPMRVRSFPFARDSAAIKHTGLFSQLRLRRQAQREGFDDALFADTHGVISEGGTWNVAFYDGTDVIWPTADVLPGVTMHLLQQAHESVTAPVTLDMLPRMQAAFATNTSIGVRPISAIDGQALNAGHYILTELQQQYLQIPGEEL
ncbi:aminotransferase class IV family protein [Streptantibioticus ferralitis]|uniref:Aminotransferase class IV family protein n=1 Tax=Streptantibioticus ferralitis TaxID=236510 RepID=A0ABT5ZAQ2_9ACTN|nr:aminotransferase class IV family protein [Streptantibioticus ferralitis]MDF2260917.1 aminotransferase class IV family protein [Streptantibioticus ferralitis]